MTFVFYPDIDPLPDIPLNASSETFHQYLTISCDKDGQAVPNTVCTRHSINPDIESWARENISQEIAAIGLNCQGTEVGGVAIPHTDRTRNWTLIWLLDTGGDNVSTVFWQEKGCTVERSGGYYPKSYNDLIELESHVLQPGRWLLLNAKVIHSVENLQRTRKAIQIGFWEDSKSIADWTR